MTQRDASVRPPDLPPESVRDLSPDVLADWDVGVGPEEIANWQRDRRPFPTDSVIVGGAAAVGLVGGVFLQRDRRSLGALLGLAVGAVGAGVALQVWRLRT